MDYTSAVEFLRDLKNNTYHFNIRQRMKMLLVVIGEHPDSMSLIQNMGIIDPDRIKVLCQKGANGYVLAQALMDSIEISTPNSDELSLKTFGYIKPITPAELDNYIDEVIERLENQKQYLKNETEVERINQEIALDELEQFL